MRTMIRISLLIPVLMLMATTAVADTINFETDAIGSAPAGWAVAKTGTGNPKWSVEKDPTAPSKSNVVKQSGRHVPTTTQVGQQPEGWLRPGSV
jgi:hypothetical protein